MTFFDDYTVMDVAIAVSLSMTGIAIFLSFFRLVVGPTLPDRVVSIDLITVLSVGFIAIFSIYTEQPVLLDVAIVLALIAFLGTVAFARYLERRGRDD
jgi:multicomponent Na+:H+ antiporter subunit F